MTEAELKDLRMLFLPKEVKNQLLKADKKEKKTQKKGISNSEHAEQVSFFRELNKLALIDNRLLYAFAIPNGNKRDAITGAHLKAEGVKSGVPDIFIPINNGEFNGLFIEMKIKPNKPSENQLKYIDYLNKNSYLAVVSYSSNEALAVVCKYLKINTGVSNE